MSENHIIKTVYPCNGIDITIFERGNSITNVSARYGEGYESITTMLHLSKDQLPKFIAALTECMEAVK